jgi:hypothetical protein
MKGCDFLRLMSNKIIPRSYSLHLIFFGKNGFSNYVKNCKILLGKVQGVLGVRIFKKWP